MKARKNEPCTRCLAPRRIVGKLCGYCYAADVRRFEERSEKSRIVVKDAFGSIRTGQGKGILKRALPVGTTVIRKHNGQGARFIKVKMNGIPQRRWMHYTRWWWEENRGPVPPGKLVIHADGNTLNDDPSNYVLGTPGTKLALAHRRNPQWSRDQHLRAAAGCAEMNRKRGRINRSVNFLKNYWYPVVDDLGVILNVPFRRRKRVLACFGADVSRYPSNGHGKKAASLVQRALRAVRVRPVMSAELTLRRFSTYCLLDPVSQECRGPMSAGISTGQLVAHIDRMGIWAPAQKHAKRDLRERK